MWKLRISSEGGEEGGGLLRMDSVALIKKISLKKKTSI